MWGGHVTYQSSILTSIRCEELMWHIKVLYLQALDVRSSFDISKFYTYKHYMWGAHVTYQSSILTSIRCEELMWHIKDLYLQALDVRSSYDISKFYTYKHYLTFQVNLMPVSIELLYVTWDPHIPGQSNACKYGTLIYHMSSSHLMLVSIELWYVIWAPHI
jgi:hypothetical protein